MATNPAGPDFPQSPLVDIQELHQELTGDPAARPVVLDVRYSPAVPTGASSTRGVTCRVRSSSIWRPSSPARDDPTAWVVGTRSRARRPSRRACVRPA
ncbi:hypothetical protein [Arsenicicoccus piscis]|uniref:hypothetical protein n=1 Tax=Arsenicicoccus piscis TaxID=673954 RepID=UPI0024E0EDD7|nr:hypothetical protein [Arsenicicoccus piscis]